MEPLANEERTLDSTTLLHEALSIGPLFKELYTGLIDVEDPAAWGPMLAKQTKSLLAHTTDIQTLAQFHSLHQVPKKHGTSYHYKTYVQTIEQLKA